MAVIDTGAVEDLQETLLDCAPQQDGAGYRIGSAQAGFLESTLKQHGDWRVQAPAAWREHPAILLGAKYTTKNGITFLGEYFTPPNIPYFQDMTPYPLTGRQHSLFLSAGKNRLRELPGWKQWDVSAAAFVRVVAGLSHRVL